MSYLAGYRPDAHRYDELLDGSGALRAHWRPLMERLAAAADMRGSTHRSLQLTRRLIAANGVTYNMYADPHGADRPWTLDPLPLVLTAQEWAGIEQGVAQRARLLNALLADLYGPQRLIAEGLVPPQIPFGHPNFLWPCYGLTPRDGVWLHLYAADLARAPDGCWRLVADRTQAPSGAGYALENREIIEQVLPDAIRELGVRRVRGFFGDLRERLLQQGTEGASLAVILTPGPYNETYFEQAYLAYQLGWPLVEGPDLTVRGDTVFLKTLGGLRRVDAIVRRVDDDYCDPLELRSGSALGVPGLIGAVRAGRVILANALGSGVLESAAWLTFLPAVAERLLGEPLRLPSVASWWCGERCALEHVVGALERLVVLPTYPNQRLEAPGYAALPRRARAEWIARLRAQPHAYVAREPLALSQAPSLQPDGGASIAARTLSLRVYALAGPRGYVVMPGGLARVASDSAPDVVSNQRGGGSKDVWILPQQVSVGLAEAAATGASVPVRHDEIPSRLVENLYWFGRYSARCEDKARLLRATLTARIDAPLYEAAVRCCRELGALAAETDAAMVLREEIGSHGIIADARRLVRCASQIRSRLSATYWRTVVELQRQLQEGTRLRVDQRKGIEDLLLSLAAFTGLALDDMRQDQGWRLLCIGRRIERLQFSTALLTHHLLAETAIQPQYVQWLLEACDSLRVYRPRYAVAPRLGPMLDLLARDAQHTRSLAFQRDALASDLAVLAAWSGSGTQERLCASLPQLNDVALVALEGQDVAAHAERVALAEQLRAVCGAAEQLSDRLSMRYFSHTRLDAQALAS